MTGCLKLLSALLFTSGPERIARVEESGKLKTINACNLELEGVDACLHDLKTRNELIHIGITILKQLDQI